MMLKGISTSKQYAEESRRNGLYSSEESFPRLGSRVNLQRQAGLQRRGEGESASTSSAENQLRNFSLVLES